VALTVTPSKPASRQVFLFRIPRGEKSLKRLPHRLKALDVEE
jgi:hypothetical protein